MCWDCSGDGSQHSLVCAPEKTPMSEGSSGKPLADVTFFVTLPGQCRESSVNHGLLPFQKSYPGPAGRSAWWWQQEPTELPLPSPMFVACSGCSPPCGCWLRAQLLLVGRSLRPPGAYEEVEVFFSVCFSVVGDILKCKNQWGGFCVWVFFFF